MVNDGIKMGGRRVENKEMKMKNEEEGQIELIINLQKHVCESSNQLTNYFIIKRCIQSAKIKIYDKQCRNSQIYRKLECQL